MSRLLQDEMEGYECQRLSRWFASRIDARQTVRKHHDSLSPTDLHLLLRSPRRTPTSTDDTTHMHGMW
jgi:hypothetical protein